MTAETGLTLRQLVTDAIASAVDQPKRKG